MTMYQQQLLEQAHEYWDRGAVVPLMLFAQLAQEGMDVLALEAKHQKEL